MYKKMLVPLDGSDLAEQVFVYAKELAGRLDLQVDLLHVCAREQYEMLPMHGAYMERVADRLRSQIDGVRVATGGAPKAEAPRIVGKVRVGYAAEEILRYADEEKADIILMATHGRSGITRWVLGSVADKALRASKVPVLLVRTGIPEEVMYDKWPKRTILVPLDGSELAEAVLPHVETLARQRGVDATEVVLLRVNEQPAIPADYPASRPVSWEEHVEQMMARSKQEGEQYLAGVQKRFAGTGLKTRSEVVMGRPADAIIDYSNQNRFNLIVMATHGRSGLSRWAFGSVAEKILVGGSSPVLLVRPR
jgi:nucleotide-binding universal stress UspA family protein